MRLALAFLKRDFTIATSYRVAFVVQLLQVFVVVSFFYLASKPFKGTWPDFLSNYGNNYFAFLIIGIAFVDYLALSIKTFSENLRDSQLMGTLEIILLSPTPIIKLLVYSSLWGYCFTSIRFVLYMLFALLFGLEVGQANILTALIIIVFAILSFVPFGIIIASTTMIIKKADFLNSLLNASFVFLGGVIYPTSVLPSWLRVISESLPFTYALDGMRLALIKGYSIQQVLPQLSVLLVFSTILTPISILSFWGAVKYTKKTGTLADY